MVSKEGPKVAVADVNNDGLDDMYVGGAKHQPGTLFIQTKNGFTVSKQPSFKADSVFEDTDALFVDVDNDKDLDLYVVTGGNEFFGDMDQQDDRLYINDGKGNFVRDKQALPALRENKSCVKAFDFDNDGDIDIFAGGRVVGYSYGKPAGSFLLVNDGKGKFTDETDRLAPALRKAGMITDAAWSDLDKDGKTELIVAGDWMPLKVFRFDGEKFSETTDIIDGSSVVRNMNGFWQALSVADMDGDGDMDIVAGNIGLNTRFRKNGDESKLLMYLGDFDKNGQKEQIVGYTNSDGKIYPMAMKDELAKQMPSLITKRFNEYKNYAGKTLDEILGNVIHADSVFASLYFENVGGLKFNIHVLPNEAQLSKVFAVITDDLDKDGKKDIFLAGNFYGGSAYQSVYDASQGILLKNTGSGFVSMPAQVSGLWLKGQVRDIEPIRTGNGIIYVVSKNGGKLDFIKLQ